MEKQEEKVKSRAIISTASGDLVATENFFCLVNEKEGVRTLMALSASPDDMVTIAQALVYAAGEALAQATGVDGPEDNHQPEGALSRLREIQAEAEAKVAAEGK